MAQRERSRHSRPRSGKPNGKGRFDSALIDSKNLKPVELVLALPTPLTDEDGNVTVQILEVDTYAIRVRKKGDEFPDGTWISKAFIVSATIL
jgi:hypothetical protein